MTAGVRSSKLGFAIQVDKSNDVSYCCQILVYAQFIQNNGVKTKLWMREELSDTTKGKDIFNVLDKLFTQNNLIRG